LIKEAFGIEVKVDVTPSNRGQPLNAKLPTPCYVKLDAGSFEQATPIKWALMLIVTTSDTPIEQFKTDALLWANQVVAKARQQVD